MEAPAPKRHRIFDCKICQCRSSWHLGKETRRHPRQRDRAGTFADLSRGLAKRKGLVCIALIGSRYLSSWAATKSDAFGLNAGYRFLPGGPGSLVSETKVLARRLKRILKWQSIEDISNPYEVMAKSAARAGLDSPAQRSSAHWPADLNKILPR
jgi:hypothetical protein